MTVESLVAGVVGRVSAQTGDPRGAPRPGLGPGPRPPTAVSGHGGEEGARRRPGAPGPTPQNDTVKGTVSVVVVPR